MDDYNSDEETDYDDCENGVMERRNHLDEGLTDWDVGLEGRTRTEVEREPFQIYYEGYLGKTRVIEVRSEETIRDVKYRIQDKEGVMTRGQRLTFCGKQLEDGWTLEDYCIQRGSKVVIIMGGNGIVTEDNEEKRFGVDGLYDKNKDKNNNNGNYRERNNDNQRGGGECMMVGMEHAEMEKNKEPDGWWERGWRFYRQGGREWWDPGYSSENRERDQDSTVEDKSGCNDASEGLDSWYERGDGGWERRYK